MMGMTPFSGVQGCCAADDAGGPYACEGGARPKKPVVERGTTAAYTALKPPIMLGSLPITMLAVLLPMYAKQLRATALGSSGRFAAPDQGGVILRPIADAIGRLRLHTVDVSNIGNHGYSCNNAIIGCDSQPRILLPVFFFTSLDLNIRILWVTY
jgi:hypothetical protein